MQKEVTEQEQERQDEPEVPAKREPTQPTTLGSRNRGTS